MRKLLTASVLVIGAVYSAYAADLGPVYKTPPAPPPAPPPPSWTGCYVAGGAGYGVWKQDTTGTEFSGGTLSILQTVGGEGWFGTVQGGCDYQFSTAGWGNWLVGAFGDWDFGSLKGNPHFAFDHTAEEKEDHSWAVGGRLGWLVFPQLLTYISGGYTQAHFDQMTVIDEFGSGAIQGFVPATTYKGWFFGSGYEYALPWIKGLYWKTEYRFAEYSNEDLVTPDGIVHAKKNIQTIRSALVWRFNWY